MLCFYDRKSFTMTLLDKGKHSVQYLRTIHDTACHGIN